MHSTINFPDTFSRSELFVGIEEDKLSDIFSFGEFSIYESGDTIFREGDPAVKFYLVMRGRLKLSKLHEDGKEAIVRYINAGGVTAAISVFNEKNYPATAQAIGLSEVVGWSRDTMLELMTVYPQMAINLLGAVVERLDDIQNRYLELQTERVEQRIAKSLLRIMKQSGHKTKEGILIDFSLSRQDLADYTGTTLYTVSRTLSSWEKRGWISSNRKRIVVVNPHALVNFSETG